MSVFYLLINSDVGFMEWENDWFLSPLKGHYLDHLDNASYLTNPKKTSAVCSGKTTFVCTYCGVLLHPKGCFRNYHLNQQYKSYPPDQRGHPF